MQLTPKGPDLVAMHWRRPGPLYGAWGSKYTPEGDPSSGQDGQRGEAATRGLQAPGVEVASTRTTVRRAPWAPSSSLGLGGTQPSNFWPNANRWLSSSLRETAKPLVLYVYDALEMLAPEAKARSTASWRSAREGPLLPRTPELPTSPG